MLNRKEQHCYVACRTTVSIPIEKRNAESYDSVTSVALCNECYWIARSASFTKEGTPFEVWYALNIASFFMY